MSLIGNYGDLPYSTDGIRPKGMPVALGIAVDRIGAMRDAVQEMDHDGDLISRERVLWLLREEADRLIGDCLVARIDTPTSGGTN